MELFFFLLLLVVTAGLAIVGLKTGNHHVLMLACVLCIGLGALVLSEGLTTQKVVSYEIDDLNASAPTMVTPVYALEAPWEATEILVLGWLLLTGGFVFLLFTVYYSFMGGDAENAS